MSCSICGSDGALEAVVMLFNVRLYAEWFCSSICMERGIDIFNFNAKKAILGRLARDVLRPCGDCNGHGDYRTSPDGAPGAPCDTCDGHGFFMVRRGAVIRKDA